jgi:protein SCO1/2
MGLLCFLLMPLAAGAHTPEHAATPVKRALGGDFELLDTDGRKFNLGSQRGKIVLIYFGYTGCPDACPTDLLLFRDILERVGGRKASVQPIFISVDPARDTPRYLAAYTQAFSPDILALTGSERQLRRVARAYGAHFNYVGRRAGSSTYTVDHSVSIYVVNGAGRLVSVIPFGTPVDEVVRRIERMLDTLTGGGVHPAVGGGAPMSR